MVPFTSLNHPLKNYSQKKKRAVGGLGMEGSREDKDSWTWTTGGDQQGQDSKW